MGACVQSGDAAAWEEFIHRFQKLIATTALRTARQWGEVSAHMVDDLVQETYLKLCGNECRLLREFEPLQPGSIFGFLKVITANVTHDFLRSQHSKKRGSGKPGESLDLQGRLGVSQGTGGPASQDREILLQEIDRQLTLFAAGPNQERDHLVFWLYYRQGLSASAIGAIPSVDLTTKGVESLIFRLTRQLRSCLAARPTTEGNPESPDPEKGFRPAKSF